MAHRKQGKQTRRSVPSGVETINFVTWADEDYICSRALLLDGFLVQGAVLSNTAIEKYLKAVYLAKGTKKDSRANHNVAGLYDGLKSKGVPPLNEAYLRLLGKAYRLRYPDDLEPGFNVALNQWQLLTQLDTSVFAIRQPFGFRRSDNREVETKFDSWLNKSHPRLMDRNCAFSSFRRDTLFEQPSGCYDFRVLTNGNILEAVYAAQVTDDGNFETEGLKQNSPTDASSSSAAPLA